MCNLESLRVYRRESRRQAETSGDTCTMIQRQSRGAPNGTGGGRPQGQTARDYRTSLLIFLAQEVKILKFNNERTKSPPAACNGNACAIYPTTAHLKI